MPRVTQGRAAAVQPKRSAEPKSIEFDLTKKKELRGQQIKSGDTFTVKLPPGEWRMGGLNGRDMFEFRTRGEKKFLPLEQWNPNVRGEVELRAKAAKGWNMIGQLTFQAQGKKELFLEMRVDGGKAPKNERVRVDSSDRRSVGGGGSGSWVPRGRSSVYGGGSGGGWGGGGVGGGGS